MARNNFLEQIKRARDAAEKPNEATERETKPTEQMTDDEIQEALNKARRDLLDLQHQEIRERELAKVQGPSSPESDDGRRTLSDMLRERQITKRRTWRLAKLEREHGEAQARVQGLANRALEARERDLDGEAAALNSGRKVPKPKEPELRSQLEGAQRELEDLERRLTLAGSDRSLRLVPATAPENTGEPQKAVTVLGNLTTQNVTGGPRRGDLEQALRYLVSLGEPTVVEGAEGSDAA
jgi:hypothetical protein